MPAECKKDSLAQLQNGDWKLTLKVAAQDMPSALLEALPGTRYQAVFVEIDDVEQPVSREMAKPEKRPFHELPRPQQAGILCGDWRFIQWISSHAVYGGYLDTDDGRKLSVTSEGAAEYVRLACGVSSRAHLLRSEAAVTWDRMVSEYRQDTGLEAAP